MQKKDTKNFRIVLGFVSLVFVVFIAVYFSKETEIDYTQTPDYISHFYTQTQEELLKCSFVEDVPYGKTRSTLSSFGVWDTINLRPMRLFVLSSYSKEFEIIYEIRGLRSPPINWSQFQGDNDSLQHYSFVSYNGRVVNYFIDYATETVPRSYYNIHGLQYIDGFPISDNEITTWIGLMKKEGNSSFALMNILQPTEYFREFIWNESKFIIEFSFVDFGYIKITYIDKNQISNYEEMILAFRGYKVVSDTDERGVVDHQVNSPHIYDWSATPDDFLYYLNHTLVCLNSYFNGEFPVIDYRYEFISTGFISEYVTKNNFLELMFFNMTIGSVNRFFQIEGVLVNEYTYAGNTFEIYGYLGESAVVFAIFSDNKLIAAEFFDPQFYK